MVLRSGSVARKDLVQLREHLVVEPHFEGAHGIAQLIHVDRTDDGTGPPRS